MSPFYKYVGENPVIFSQVRKADGSTLEAQPEGVYELLEDPNTALLELVTDHVAEIVSAPVAEPVEEPVAEEVDEPLEAPAEPTEAA